MAWKTTPCDSSACVQVHDDPANMFVLLRTTWLDMPVPIIRDEWKAFVQAVKDGKFD